MTPENLFHLDNIAMLFAEFKMRRARLNADKKWCDEFGEAAKTMAGGASEWMLQGHPVARLVPGQLNMSLLKKEQPVIVTKYTKMTVKEAFDQDAFAAELPDVFGQYRAQRLVLVSEPGVAL